MALYANILIGKRQMKNLHSSTKSINFPIDSDYSARFLLFVFFGHATESHSPGFCNKFISKFSYENVKKRFQHVFYSLPFGCCLKYFFFSVENEKTKKKQTFWPDRFLSMSTDINANRLWSIKKTRLENRRAIFASFFLLLLLLHFALLHIVASKFSDDGIHAAYVGDKQRKTEAKQWQNSYLSNGEKSFKFGWFVVVLFFPFELFFSFVYQRNKLKNWFVSLLPKEKNVYRAPKINQFL